ncbi:hypothetical protein [Paenibacillus xylanexedens]|uniref:hypothetical protein n=1 Tax=Paenibacillus xylanexedens TaxID=528191 RepID=UPI0016437BF7|nr:hypothetical protein [Paenibacillus xylanexedens]
MTTETQTFLGGVPKEAVADLIGKFIHVPTNMVPDPENEGEEVNAWFAGQVAGFDTATLAFDFRDLTFFEDKGEENMHILSVLTTDGISYMLSDGHVEIKVLTKEEFDVMLTEHLAKQALEAEGERQIQERIAEAKAEASNVIQLPQKKILLPGEDN